MYVYKKKILDFDIRYIGPRLRLVLLTTPISLSEHISLTEINDNHFKEIRGSFLKYSENRKQTNLKLLYFKMFDGFLPK